MPTSENEKSHSNSEEEESTSTDNDSDGSGDCSEYPSGSSAEQSNESHTGTDSG